MIVKLKLPKVSMMLSSLFAKKYLIFLLNHIHHLQKQLTLHIIKYIKVFSDKPDNLSLVLLLNGRVDFKRVIMESVVSIFIRSWIGISRR